jgi:hypothetical protein
VHQYDRLTFAFIKIGELKWAMVEGRHNRS